MTYILLIILCVTHAIAYYMGRHDGAQEGLSEEAWLELQKYETDKRFEYMRWTRERTKHEEP